MRSVLSCFFMTLIIFGCTPDHYTLEDFSKVKKIDTHIHLNAESPALAELAKEDNFFMLTINVDASTPIDKQEKHALSQIRQSPEQVKYLTTFNLNNWNSPSWADSTIARLKNSFAQGALGIKIWKNIGMVHRDSAGGFIMIDNPRFDPVIQYVIDQDKTVLGHLGEPKNCWLPLEQMTVNNDRNYFKEHPEYHMFLHPEFPSYEDQINARDRFLEKHPDMRFVGAHLASLEWDVDELAKRLDRFPNMGVDMAARVPHLQHQTKENRKKIQDFFIKYQDRLIYATDGGISESSDPESAKKNMHEAWLADWKYLATDQMLTSRHVNGEFQGLQLPKEIIDKVYRSNAIRWFKIPQD
jgi:hypothetical protein